MSYGDPIPAMPAVGDAQPAAEDVHLAVHDAIAACIEAKVTATDLLITAADIPHGDRSVPIGARLGFLIGGTGTAPASAVQYWLNANSLALQFLPQMITGDRIKSLTARVRPNGVGQQWTVTVYRVSPYGTRTSIGSQASTTGTVDENVTVTVTPTTLGADEYIIVEVFTASAVATGRVYSVTPVWDRL